MKVLRIIARLNVGGPARHVVLLDAGLRTRGHQTCLVFGALDTGEASLEAPAVASGIPLVRLPRLAKRVSAVADLRAFVSLLGLMFREQPDVVHTHTAKAGALGRLAALAFNATRRRHRRALIVHTFHGHVFEGYFSSVLSRLVCRTERWLSRATDVVITISPRQRTDIVERFSIAPGYKTVVVPLGLDLEGLLALRPGAATLRESIGADPGDIVVGFAGRMVPVKDVPTLLRAFARAQAQTPQLRLLLAGDGPERSTTLALASELGVASRVHFAGWLDDLPRFYATIDLFALSSINEGTPVSVIEAMAAGKAVIATAVGGVPDVVESGSHGLLVPAGDVDAMAVALSTLARSHDLRSRMGEAGRCRARERYSHVRLVDDIERLYVKALRDKRG